MENEKIVQNFTQENVQLLQDVRNVFISVAIGAAGYFLVELGKGLISAVTKNGIRIPDIKE